jgi:hypothetical protein
MAECDDIHRQFDRLANGALQVGELPAWTRVQGKVAWYLFQGPYGGMSDLRQAIVHARTALHVAASSPADPVGLLGSSSPL